MTPVALRILRSPAFQWVALVPVDGPIAELAGSIDVTLNPWGELDLAWHVYEGFRRQGVATQLARHAIAELRNLHPQRRITATIRTDNLASRGVAEKVGMVAVRRLDRNVVMGLPVADEEAAACGPGCADYRPPKP